MNELKDCPFCGGMLSEEQAAEEWNRRVEK